MFHSQRLIPWVLICLLGLLGTLASYDQAFSIRTYDAKTSDSQRFGMVGRHEPKYNFSVFPYDIHENGAYLCGYVPFLLFHDEQNNPKDILINRI